MSLLLWLQRLTCCLLLLFTTMLANAMFYKTAEVEHDQTVRLGPFIFSAAALLVSVYSSIVVVPINLLIVQLFRKSKPADWQAEGQPLKPNNKSDVSGPAGNEGDGFTPADGGSQMSAVNETGIRLETEKEMSLPCWKQTYPLPHWCVYVAWGLAASTIALSAFFIILYSLDFGVEKSQEWMLALVYSFVESVLFVQPFKVPT